MVLAPGGRLKRGMCLEPTLGDTPGWWACFQQVWAVAHFRHVRCAAARAKNEIFKKAL